MSAMSVLEFLFQSDVSTVATAVATSLVLLAGATYWTGVDERRQRRARKHRRKKH